MKKYLITGQTNAEYDSLSHVLFSITDTEKQAIKEAAKWLNTQPDIIESVSIIASNILFLDIDEDSDIAIPCADEVIEYKENWNLEELPKPSEPLSTPSFIVGRQGFEISAFEKDGQADYFSDIIDFKLVGIIV